MKKAMSVQYLSAQISEAVFEGIKESGSREQWSMYTVFLNLTSGKVFRVIHLLNEYPYYHQPWIIQLLKPENQSNVDTVIEELLESAIYLLEKEGWAIIDELKECE